MRRPKLEDLTAILPDVPLLAWHQKLYELVQGQTLPEELRIYLPYDAAEQIAVVYFLARKNPKLPTRLVLPLPSRAQCERLLRALRQSLETARTLGLDVELVEDMNGYDWRIDPAKSQIIVGTPVELTQRLLFSGPDTKNQRPILAAMLGQDALWVLTDAHVEQQVAHTLKVIFDEQRRCREPRPIWLWHVSPVDADHADIGITVADAKRVPQLQRRRKFDVERVKTGAALCERVVAKAVEYDDYGVRVLITVNRVSDVDKIAKKLSKRRKNRVSVLTGTYRGAEREAARQLARDRFHGNAEDTVYLVTTPAVESGPVLDADVLITEHADVSQLQHRFEQCNRSGERRGEIHVIVRNDIEDADLGRAERWLTTLEGDASGVNIVRNRGNLLTSTEGELTTIDEATLDLCSLTSIDAPRSPIASYVYSAYEAPRTTLVWRNELPLFAEFLTRREKRSPTLGLLYAQFLDLYPLRAEEKVSVPTHEFLAALKDEDSRHPVAVIAPSGVHVQKNVFAWPNYRDCTVVVPPEFLLLDAEGRFGRTERSAERRAVAEVLAPKFDPPHNKRGTYARAIVRWERGQWCCRGLENPEQEGRGPTPDAAIRSFRKEHPEFDETMRLRGVVTIGPDYGDPEDDVHLPVFVERRWPVFDSSGAPVEQSLKEHQAHVVRVGEALLDALAVSEPERSALLFAMANHDLGKNRPWWQQAVGNFDGAKIVAKSKHRYRPEVADGYAHEVGSLLDAQRRSLPQCAALALHGIIAHHGQGRPSIDPRGFDPAYAKAVNEDAAQQQVDRFTLLQRRYGRWGLAWLESLVRAADCMASKELREQG